MTKKQNHRWNTKEYENRTKELYRTDLYKLYPSESWALSTESYQNVCLF